MNNRTPVHITEGSGKMQGIPSVNTSSLENEFCQEQSKDHTSICSKCYSSRYSKMRSRLEARLKENSKLLSSRILDQKELPVFNHRFVRFNSFGELINETHYLNLIQIAHNNPYTIFALWTKRKDIVMKYPREKNIVYVLSIPEINPSVISHDLTWDVIFTIWDDKDAKINCKSHCLYCLWCYMKHDIPITINERLK